MTAETRRTQRTDEKSRSLAPQGGARDDTQRKVLQVEEFAQSYEDPQQVMKYYYSDRRRLSEVEALVLEENVVNYVLGKAKVSEKAVSFDELMGNNAQA